MASSRVSVIANYGREVSIFKTDLHKVVFFIFIILLAMFPLFPFVSNYWLRLMVNFSITIICVTGLNILTGLCGQGSIGHAGFMAIGAYSSVILIEKCGLSFWSVMPCAALITGVSGTIFGLSSLKVRGLYLFLVTLGAHFIIEYVIIHFPEITGGPSGISVVPPKLGGLSFKSLRNYYYIVLVVLILTVWIAKNLLRTHIGRAWQVIGEKEIVAKAMGISVYRYKLLAFFIGCAYAGVAGCLWAHSKSWLAPEDFSLFQACWFLGMIIIGGYGNLLGSILGPIFLLGLGELSKYVGPMLGKLFPFLSMGIFAASAELIYSAVIILFLVFEPRGLVHFCSHWALSFRRKRFVE